jgi:hypothetical protein
MALRDHFGRNTDKKVGCRNAHGSYLVGQRRGCRFHPLLGRKVGKASQGMIAAKDFRVLQPLPGAAALALLAIATK